MKSRHRPQALANVRRGYPDLSYETNTVPHRKIFDGH